MTTYEKALTAMNALFGQDLPFVLATVKDNIPSQRVVDTYFDGKAFWIVTYGLSNKVKELRENSHVSLCRNFFSFSGTATWAGHPLKEENKEIRDTLIRVYAPWYFAHNDEGDENMCYVSVTPQKGFFHQDGTGYKVDFENQTAQEFPFAPDISME